MRVSGLRSIGPNAAKSTTGTRGNAAAPAQRRRADVSTRLTCALTSASVMRPLVAGALDLREVDAELARELADRRARVRPGEARLVDRLPLSAAAPAGAGDGLG